MKRPASPCAGWKNGIVSQQVQSSSIATHVRLEIWTFLVGYWMFKIRPGTSLQRRALDHGVIHDYRSFNRPRGPKNTTPSSLRHTDATGRCDVAGFRRNIENFAALTIV